MQLFAVVENLGQKSDTTAQIWSCKERRETFARPRGKTAEIRRQGVEASVHAFTVKAREIE